MLGRNLCSARRRFATPSSKKLAALAGAITAVTSLFQTDTARAANGTAYYFDANGITTGFGAPSGSYNENGNYWSTDSSGTTTLAALPASAQLTFGSASTDLAGATFSVNMNSNKWRGLQINSTSANVTLTGTTNAYLDAPQTWTVAAGSTLTEAMTWLFTTNGYNGLNFNNQALTLAGGGTINFNTVLGLNSSGLITENGSGLVVNLQPAVAGGMGSGGYALTSGTLNFANANSVSSLSTGLFTITGGAFDNTTGSAQTLSALSGYRFGGSFTFVGSNDLSLGTPAVVLTANSQVNVASHTLTIPTSISGAYSFAKAGAGTLILSSANTWTGATTVSGGTLSVISGGVINSTNATTNTAVITGGSTLDVNGGTANFNGATSSTIVVTLGDSTSAGNIQVRNGGTLNVNTGYLVVGSTATSSLTSTFTQSSGTTTVGNHLYAGNYNPSTLTISGGTFTTGGSGLIGVRGNTTLTISGDASVKFTAGTVLGYGSGLTGSGTLNLSGGTLSTSSVQMNSGHTSTFNFNGGTLKATAATTSFMTGLTIAYVKANSTLYTDYPITIAQNLLTDGTHTAGLTKSGTGTLILTGSSTYTGATTISAGAIQLGDGSTKNGSLAGPVVNNGSLVIANPASQSFTKSISGTGGLTKSGTGTLILAATNTYHGATTISAGTVRLAPDNLPANQKIMPIGDSITYGSGGTNAGYRGPLYNLLAGVVPSFQFIGTSNLNAGTLPTTPINETYSEGHPSYTISDVNNNLDGFDNATFLKYGSASRDPNGGYWLTGGTGTGRNPMYPDVILLMIGTNDLTIQTGVQDRLDALLTKFTTLRPDARLIVADITPTTRPNVVSYNQIVNAEVAKFQSQGANVSLVDLYTNFPSNGLTADNVHPNDVGYNWMADQWSAAILSSYSGVTTSAIPSDSPVTVASGATLDLNGTLASIGPLAGAGNVTLGAGSLTVNTVSGTTTNFSGTLSGAGRLTLSGPGALQLSGVNTYAGPTTIHSGTLEIASTGDIDTSASFVQMDSGATFKRGIAFGSTYASDLRTQFTAGLQSTADILAGNAAADVSVSITWRIRTTGETPGGPSTSPPMLNAFNGIIGLASDVVTITGTNPGDFLVVQMSYDEAEIARILGYSGVVGDSNWNAFESNQADLHNIGLAWFDNTYWQIQGIDGNLGAYTDQLTLGQWGVDTTNNLTWVVVDRGGSYAAVPEPSSLGLLGIAALGLLIRRRQPTAGASLTRFKALRRI